jgi:O-antigen ligase
MFRNLTVQTSTGRQLLGSQQPLSILLIAAVVAALVIVPMPFSIGLLIAPAAAIVLLLNPILLILGLVVSVPVQDAIPVPEGVPVTATRLFTVAAFLLTPPILVGRNSRASWTWLMIPVLGLMGVMAVSLVNAHDLGAGFAELYRWLVALFALWITLQFLQTRAQVITGVVVIAALAILQGGLGIVQALTGAGPASFQIGAGFSRAFGTFGMPNSYAAYMEMVTLPLIPLAIWAGNRALAGVRNYRIVRRTGFYNSIVERSRALRSTGLFLLISLGLVAGLASIAVSFSRGGWVGTIAALTVIVLLLGRRAVATALATTLVLTFGLLVGASGAIITVIEDRFVQLVDQIRIGDVRGVPVTDDNFAAIERMSHWQTAIAMWDQYPWLGVGVGNFDERFTEFAIHPQFPESQGHAHNYYLHLLAEVGIVGLVTYLALIVSVLVIGWKAYRSRDSLTRSLGIGVLGTSAALIMHNAFENLHVLNITVQMAFLWAMALIAIRLSDGNEHDDPASFTVRRDSLQYDSRGFDPRDHAINADATVRERN